MQNKLAKLQKYFATHQFACFISLCVIVALIMTGVSLDLYKRSGAMKLDMSRPGYEKVRQEVEKDTDNRPFDSSGALDQSTVQDFANRLDEYQKQLNELGDYSNDNIQDENFNLIDQSSTTNTSDNAAVN